MSDLMVTLKFCIGRVVLDTMGWDVEGLAPSAAKYVLVAAPHTSNWDLPVTLGVAWVLGIDPVWAAKHTLFEGPLGWFFRRLGGIAIDRRARHDQVQQLARLFAERDRMILVIAPEGTRSRTPYWKSGFYWIARAANVPIALGYLDYARRRGGISEPFMPSESLDDDVARIRDFYAKVTAKYPELFTNIELRPIDVRAPA